MDFVTNTLVDGRRFRVLTVIGIYSRECVLLTVDFSLKAPKVVAALEQLCHGGRRPRALTVDNGSDWASSACCAKSWPPPISSNRSLPWCGALQVYPEDSTGRYVDYSVRAKATCCLGTMTLLTPYSTLPTSNR